jgi:hypothetical protein
MLRSRFQEKADKCNSYGNDIYPIIFRINKYLTEMGMNDLLLQLSGPNFFVRDLDSNLEGSTESFQILSIIKNCVEKLPEKVEERRNAKKMEHEKEEKMGRYKEICELA